MSEIAPWLAIYRHFDDDALAALASTGLVRRAVKDVEAGKVAWIDAPGPVQGVLGADGQRVTVNGGGPAKAMCDCPAPGLCKHILAASIWLRNVAPPAAVAAENVVAEVLALDPAALCKAAGVAATRRAHALFADSPVLEVTLLPGALLMALPELDFTCRYIASAGFAGMVSEVPATSRAAVHLLALACVWRSEGRAFVWPAALEATALLAADGPWSDGELAFIARVQALLLEICRSGWSHMSAVMPLQLRALALSARVEAFPRLAAMLRTLAATGTLLVARDLHADERQAIALAARIYALCAALAASTGATRDALRGSSRRAFDGSAARELLPLGAHWWEQRSAARELLPLGAHWWEQRSGARGLTMSFWDPDTACILQAALARRDGADTTFSRGQTWSSHALWQGAGSAEKLSAGAVALEQMQVSGDNKISLSTETRARALPAWRLDDTRWDAAGIDDWNTLAAMLRASAGLRGDPLDAVLLRPASCDAPWLDEPHQLFYWTLRDTHGAALPLRLSCEAVHHARIAHIEAWFASATPILAVVARLARGGDGVSFEPLAIVIASGATLRAVSLDFEAPPHHAPTLRERLTHMLQAKAVAPKTGTPPPAAARQFPWIDALQETIEHMAMTGRLHLPGRDATLLAQIEASARASGVDVVADAVTRYLAQPGADTALALHYLCQVCAELDAGTLAGA